MRTRLRDLCAAALVSALSITNATAETKGDPGQEFTRGLAAMSRGDLDDAARRFEAVIKIDPQAFEAHNNLAVIYTQQAKYDAALSELHTVLKLKPDYYRGRKNLAELYARMAHAAFLDAAALAPPDEKQRLDTRARLIASPTGSTVPSAVASGVLEPSGAPPAAAPAEAVKAEPAPALKLQTALVPEVVAPPGAAEAIPAEFLVLADGVPGIGLSDGGLRLYRQMGTNIQAAERIAVNQAAKLPTAPLFYVAVPGEARIELVPLNRTGRAISIADSAAGKGDVLVDSQAFAAMKEAVQAYLSPAVVAATLRPADASAAQGKRNGVSEAFRAWAKSWQAKDLEGYLASYVPDYNPRGGPGGQKWREQRGKVFERSGDISISLSEPAILEAGDTLITLTRQEYRSKLQTSTGVKKVTWASTPQGWKITGEEMLSEKIQKTPG